MENYKEASTPMPANCYTDANVAGVVEDHVRIYGLNQEGGELFMKDFSQTLKV